MGNLSWTGTENLRGWRDRTEHRSGAAISILSECQQTLSLSTPQLAAIHRTAFPRQTETASLSNESMQRGDGLGRRRKVGGRLCRA